MNKIIKLMFVVCLSLFLQANSKEQNLDKQTLNNVEIYLNSITSLVADFKQTNSDAKESYGKLFIKRPGKLKWQYDVPVPISIIIDRNNVTQYDMDLEQISYTTIDSRLATFLAQKNIKFDQDVLIDKFFKEDNYIIILLKEKNKFTKERLSLIFNVDPMKLTEIGFINKEGMITNVKLSNVIKGINLEDKLFSINNFMINKK